MIEKVYEVFFDKLKKVKEVVLSEKIGCKICEKLFKQGF